MRICVAAELWGVSVVLIPAAVFEEGGCWVGTVLTESVSRMQQLEELQTS